MFINEECEKYTFLSLAAHVEYCTANKIVIYGLLILTLTAYIAARNKYVHTCI